jgi:hypothetical protein
MILLQPLDMGIRHIAKWLIVAAKPEDYFPLETLTAQRGILRLPDKDHLSARDEPVHDLQRENERLR